MVICLPSSASFDQTILFSAFQLLSYLWLILSQFTVLSSAFLSKPTQNAQSGAVSTLQGLGMRCSSSHAHACPVSHVLSFLRNRRLYVPPMCPLFCLGFPSTSFFFSPINVLGITLKMLQCKQTELEIKNHQKPIGFY